MALRTGRRRREPLRAEPLNDDSIDLRDNDHNEVDESPTISPAEAAELHALLRARAAQAEAERELIRLRARHWSGERLLEESRIESHWWEHPEADPYAVLGLLPGASLEDASRARREIARRCHPDRLAEGANADRAMRRMVAANSAFDRLRRALLPTD